MDRLVNEETGGHGGDLTLARSKWGADGRELLDFSSNVNPLGPPPGLLQYLQSILPEITAYPSPQARELRVKLACYFNVPVEKLILGNGANELIHLLMLWRRPSRVIVPAPSFSEYERAALLAGAAVEYYSVKPDKKADFLEPVKRLKKGDIMVVCNPNNPTGQLFSRRELVPVVAEAESRGASIVIDESFIPLTGKPEESLRHHSSENLWIITSLTKIWGLPGLRIGFSIGPENEVDEISRRGDPWRVNILAQKAGLYCLEKEDYLQQTLDLVEREREYLLNSFRTSGSFQVFSSSTNFILLKGTAFEFEVAAFQADLAEKGILIRRADNFRELDRRYFRVAVRQHDENNKLVSAVDEWLQEKNASPAYRPSGGDAK